MNSFLTPWRLKWYSILILTGLLLALIISVVSGRGAKTLMGRLGGDFPSPYAAGRIVISGDFDQLYDPVRQYEEQKNLLPGETGYLHFAYPPFVFFAYAPIAFLPYRIAYIIHTSLMVGALIFSMQMWIRIHPPLKPYLLPILALTISFYPIFSATFKGLNTSFTLLLITFVWKLVLDKRPYLAGLFLGLLFYKPQFALPLTGIFFLSGRWRVALSSSAVAIFLISICSLIPDFDWIEWFRHASWFSSKDALANRANAVSWLGFLEAIFGSGYPPAVILGAIFSVLTAFGISLVWFVGGTKADFNAQMGLAAVSIILISPHVMYYDIGLLLITYIVISINLPKQKACMIAMVWLMGFTQIFSNFLGFSPLFLLVFFTAILSIKKLVLARHMKGGSAR